MDYWRWNFSKVESFCCLLGSRGSKRLLLQGTRMKSDFHLGWPNYKGCDSDPLIFKIISNYLLVWLTQAQKHMGRCVFSAKCIASLACVLDLACCYITHKHILFKGGDGASPQPRSISLFIFLSCCHSFSLHLFLSLFFVCHFLSPRNVKWTVFQKARRIQVSQLSFFGQLESWNVP